MGGCGGWESTLAREAFIGKLKPGPSTVTFQGFCMNDCISFFLFSIKALVITLAGSYADACRFLATSSRLILFFAHLKPANWLDTQLQREEEGKDNVKHLAYLEKKRVSNWMLQPSCRATIAKNSCNEWRIKQCRYCSLKEEQCSKFYQPAGQEAGKHR